MSDREVSESKYAPMVDEVRKIYTKDGANLFSDPDAYGINKHYPSKDGKIVFEFYWDSLDKIYTPDGYITPLGSYSGNGNTGELAQAALIEKFGLQFVGQRDGLRGERWFTYEATKGIPA